MDDDALRRGKTTCHRAFDEAPALLPGDVWADPMILRAMPTPFGRQYFALGPYRIAGELPTWVCRT